MGTVKEKKNWSEDISPQLPEETAIFSTLNSQKKKPEVARPVINFQGGIFISKKMYYKQNLIHLGPSQDADINYTSSRDANSPWQNLLNFSHPTDLQ